MSAAFATTRYHALDSLRASMMLLGVVLHAALPYSTLSVGKYADACTHPSIDVLLALIHSFRMPVFFMMAGFFGALLLARRGAKDMLVNRFRLVVVPLVAAWILLTPLIRMGSKFGRASRKFDSIAEGFESLPLVEFFKPQDVYHLWFLCDLVLFYPLVICGAWAMRRHAPKLRERIREPIRRMLASPWRAFVFAIPLALLLAPAPAAPVGPLTVGQALALQLSPLLFFVLGWMLHGHKDLMPLFQRHAGRQVLLALALFPISLLAMRDALLADTQAPQLPPSLALLVHALVICLLVFGLTGLFLRYLDRHMAPMRYLSDASYWIYLVHYPLVLWIAGCMAPAELPALHKLAICLGSAVPLLLLSYHYGVRSTLVGVVLNGKRVGGVNPRPQADLAPRDGHRATTEDIALPGR